MIDAPSPAPNGAQLWSTAPVTERDVETQLSPAKFVQLLRRLADAIEGGTPLRIQVANSRFTVPLRRAELGVEHEIEGDREELALELRWVRDGDADPDAGDPIDP